MLTCDGLSYVRAIFRLLAKSSNATYLVFHSMRFNIPRIAFFVFPVSVGATVCSYFLLSGRNSRVVYCMPTGYHQSSIQNLEVSQEQGKEKREILWSTFLVTFPLCYSFPMRWLKRREDHFSPPFYFCSSPVTLMEICFSINFTWFSFMIMLTICLLPIGGR